MIMIHQSANVGRRLLCAFAMCTLAVGVSPSISFAQRVRGVWDDLIRATARVADDVPVKGVDEIVADLSKSRAAREAVDAELRKSGRLTRATGAIDSATRLDEVLRLLRAATSELDPSVVRRLEQLDDSSREVALLFARGGENLSRTVPDLATRGRLLREGGAETVAAVGMFGPDAARAALRLDEAIKGGAVVVKNGGRAVSVADLGKVMTRYGAASWEFWKKYIQPHWKLWASSGALAAYLSNPEYFQDAAGRLTEAGFRHLTEFVGEVAASGIRGVGQGAGKAVEEVAQAASDRYSLTRQGLYSVIGTLLFIAGISLFFRRVRAWVLCPLRWLNGSPIEPKSSGSNVQGESA